MNGMRRMRGIERDEGYGTLTHVGMSGIKSMRSIRGIRGMAPDRASCFTIKELGMLV